MNNSNYEYDAFISYRHTEPDITIAKKLLIMLEKYKVPHNIAKKTGIKRINRIFRDREELPTTTDLSESILHALKHSRFLIVICSPRTPESEWVKKEIEVFKELHGAEKIQALLIEGEPEESFPYALHFQRSLETDADGNIIEGVKQLELLAADIRPDELKGPKKLSYGISEPLDKKLKAKAFKLLKTERLRCIAPMFNCKFDELYQRHLRQKMINITVVSLFITVLFASFTAYAIYMNGKLAEQRDIAVFQKQEVERQKKQVENERKIAEEQKELAQKNEQQAVAFSKEAEEQKKQAEEQRKEAEHQSNLAQDNEQKALDNLKIAKVQEALAKYNESRAIEERDNVLRNQSLYLANLSKQQLNNGSKMTALLLALEALPKNISEPERPVVQEAWDALNYSVNNLGQCREVVTLSNFIEDAFYSPDGKRIAVFSEYEKDLRIINAENGEESARLSPDWGTFNSAQFSPDGKIIATASSDNTVRLWEVESGRELKVFKGHTDVVRSVCFSPDGDKLVSAAIGESIIWNVQSGRKLRSLSISNEIIGYVCFSPDGKRVLTTSYDKTARIWDAESGKELSAFKSPDTYILSAGFSPDGRMVYICSNAIEIWDTVTKESKFKSEGAVRVLSAKFTPDSKQLNMGIQNGKIQVLDIATGKILRDESLGIGTVDIIEFSPDGKYIITSSDDSTVDVREANDGKFLYTLEGHGRSITHAQFSPDSSSVLTVALDKSMRIWDLRTSNLAHNLDGHSGSINSAYFSPDGSRVVTAFDDGMACICDVNSGKLIASLIGHHDKVRDARFSPDGKKVVTASNDSTVRIWDAVNGRQLKVLNGHDGFVVSAEFSADGKRIISEEGLDAYIWNAETGKEICKISKFTDVTKFSPNGKLALTATFEDSVQVWNSETGTMVSELKGHQDYITQAEFSPDSKKIFTVSADGTARIWDAMTGKELVILEGDIDYAKSARFSPDGKLVALTTSKDSSIKIWDIESGKIYKRLYTGENYMEGIEFSPDGTQILVCASLNVYIYNIEKEYLVVQLEGSFTDASFSPDGKSLLAVSLEVSGPDNTAEYTAGIISFEHDFLLQQAYDILKGRKLTYEERKEFYIY